MKNNHSISNEEKSSLKVASVSLASSSIASIGGICLAYPIDTIKTRM